MRSAPVIERRTVVAGTVAVAVAVVMIIVFSMTRDDPGTHSADAAFADDTTLPVAQTRPEPRPSAPSSSTPSSSASSNVEIPSANSTTGRSSTLPSGSLTWTSNPDEAGLLPTLSEGDTGSDVALLQRILNNVAGSGLVPDGRYGSETTAAVEAFQRFVGLTATGDADHATRTLLAMIDIGRSNWLPSWPIPTIGDGGADGCQVSVVGDSLLAGAEGLQEARLAEIGCASAVDAIGGRSLSFGWQCRVLRTNGTRSFPLLPEPEPGNYTCAPSGLELIELWSDAGALGDAVVVALGTNDAGLYTERQWIDHWQRAFEFAGERPVIVVTSQARPGSRQVATQLAYSNALRQWCTTVPRCVLADWARTAPANDAGSYVDPVHLTRAVTDARASFIRDVVAALLSKQPIPNPSPLPTTTMPTTTLATTTTPTTTTPATTTLPQASTTTEPSATSTTTTTTPATTTTAGL